MNRKMLIALFVLGCAFSAQAQDLNFNVIKTESDPSLSKMKGIYIIDNTNDLKDIWKEAFKKNNIPLIDFNNEIVIAVFRGSCPTLSYGVYVEKVEEMDESIIVYVCYRNPGRNCRQCQAISNPHFIIKIRQTDKLIEFIEYEKIKECKPWNG